MQSVKAIIIKFLMILVVLWVVLGAFGFDFGDIVITSVLVTGVSYVVGDLFILPRFNNATATISDFILAYGMIWFLGAYLFGYPEGLGTASFVSAGLIAVGEMFFHRYMQREVLFDAASMKKIDSDVYNMRTEYGAEIDFKRERERRAAKNKEKSDLTQEKDDFYNK